MMSTRPYFSRNSPIRSAGYGAVPQMMKIAAYGAPEEEVDNSEMLYHYTNLSAFTAILGNRTIRPSNALNMNDAEELSFSANFIMDIILQTNLDDKKKQSILNYLNMTLPDQLPSNIYIFSLSRHASQLSQWRAYSQPEGNSIGWSRQNLEKFASSTGGRVVDVAYHFQTQYPLAQPLIHKIIEKFEEGWIKDISVAQKSYFENFQDMFNNIAPAIKHGAFYEENEVRIIWDNSQSSIPVHFLPRTSDIKPYIEIPFNDSIMKLAAVVLGPTHDPYKRMYEVNNFLARSGLDAKNIMFCGIPFQRL